MPDIRRESGEHPPLFRAVRRPQTSAGSVELRRRWYHAEPHGQPATMAPGAILRPGESRFRSSMIGLFEYPDCVTDMQSKCCGAQEI